MEPRRKKIISLLIIGLSFGSMAVFGLVNLKKIALGDSAVFFWNSQSDKITKVAEPLPKEKVKILFVGDMMFDRWIRQVGEKKGVDFVFHNVDELLKSQDMVVGNLEGPITDNLSKSVDTEFGSKANLIFTFPSGTAAKLSEKNIRLVNIGNNHILNFSSDGLTETKKYLERSGVNFFGDTGKNEDRYFVVKINGQKIAFVNYNQFLSPDEQKTFDDLEAVRKEQPDFIVVYTHWGTEYAQKPNEKEKKLARLFVDRGADLIIGTHPHVVQEKEEYKGKMIYYSLGNFIFDQYFDPNTKRGLAVEVEIDENKKTVFKEYPLEMKTSGQTVTREK